MDAKGMVTRQCSSTNFWSALRRGPWPRVVIDRLDQALSRLVEHLKSCDAVAGLIVFGSYARGEYGRKSDVDLLILFEGGEAPEVTEAGRFALRLCGELETELRLPMHLAPLLVSVSRAHDLGPTLLHAIWTDGVVLYACANALARLQPDGLSAWTLIHFSTVNLPATDRVRLSRRLHGIGPNAGIVRPPAVILGRGTILAPGSQVQPIRDALDAAGASYDAVQVWREA